MKLLHIPNYITKDVVNYIELNVDDDDFDEKVFIEWLFDKDIEHKANPNAYLKSCLKKEIKAGTFKPQPKVSYVPNTQVLINEMRERGICVLADESVWVNVLFTYLLNEKEVDEATCRTLNKQVLNYMETKCFGEYKDLLMKSKTLLPYGIDWEYIEKKTETEIRKWNDLLDDLESEE